jgi:hypothetical protein
MSNSSQNKDTLDTTLVNVKVAYIRPKFKNLKHWIEDPNNVYIGRKGVVFVEHNSNKFRFPKRASIWANPFKINKDTTRLGVLKKYEKFIREQIRNDPDNYCIESLRGKTLGCWCYPKGCHGDILIKLLNEKPPDTGNSK